MYITGDPKLPIHLLIFAVQTAVTTSTCIADYLSWTRFSNAEKLELGKLYVPYLALCKCLSRSICGFWSLVASHRLLGLGNIMQGLTPTQETAWHGFLMRSVHQPSKATRARWAIHTQSATNVLRRMRRGSVWQRVIIHQVSGGQLYMGSERTMLI